MLNINMNQLISAVGPLYEEDMQAIKKLHFLKTSVAEVGNVILRNYHNEELQVWCNINGEIRFAAFIIGNIKEILYDLAFGSGNKYNSTKKPCKKYSDEEIKAAMGELY